MRIWAVYKQHGVRTHTHARAGDVIMRHAVFARARRAGGPAMTASSPTPPLQPPTTPTPAVQVHSLLSLGPAASWSGGSLLLAWLSGDGPNGSIARLLCIGRGRQAWPQPWRRPIHGTVDSHLGCCAEAERKINPRLAWNLATVADRRRGLPMARGATSSCAAACIDRRGGARRRAAAPALPRRGGR